MPDRSETAICYTCGKHRAVKFSNLTRDFCSARCTNAYLRSEGFKERVSDESPMSKSFQITDRQREILRHTLGLNRGRREYRNRFVTGEGSKDFADCQALVNVGLMTRHSLDWIPDFVYVATDIGRQAAREGLADA